MCCQTITGSVCAAIFLLITSFMCQLFSFASPFWIQSKYGGLMTGLWFACSEGACGNTLKNIESSTWLISTVALEAGATFLLGLTMLITCCLSARGCRSGCGFVLSAFLSSLAALCIIASLAVFATIGLEKLERTKDELWIGYWMGVPAALLGLIASCTLYRANNLHEAEEIY